MLKLSKLQKSSRPSNSHSRSSSLYSHYLRERIPQTLHSSLSTLRVVVGNLSLTRMKLKMFLDSFLRVPLLVGEKLEGQVLSFEEVESNNIDNSSPSEKTSFLQTSFNLLNTLSGKINKPIIYDFFVCLFVFFSLFYHSWQLFRFFLGKFVPKDIICRLVSCGWNFTCYPKATV